MKLLFNILSKYRHTNISPQTFVYVGMWFMITVLPIVRCLIMTNNNSTDCIEWNDVVTLWTLELPFFVLFVINATILMPFLFMKQKFGLYITTTIIALITTIYVSDIINEVKIHKERQIRDEKTMMFDIDNTSNDPFIPPFLPQDGDMFEFGHRDFPPNDMHNGPRPFIHIFHGPAVGKIFIALLLICFNIAVELFFKSQRDKKKITQLKYNEMQTKLDYLKYQINPHFFMNTLNNIHALVDIDTEKAKQTIVELSKLMRYVLYESDKKFILLQKEIQFLKHYAELMRIRYPDDSVTIEIDMPDDTGNIAIPPLLVISFVENAFKHGVSFRNESFVNITLRTDNKNIIFTCRNSNAKHNQDQHHGIGLDNIKKRLELLYPNKYVLSIDEQDDEFSVLMVIPATIIEENTNTDTNE